MKKFLSLLLVSIVSLACFASCGNKLDPKVIKIGASPAPHKEILMQIKDELAKKGYTLEIVEYADFILPNKAVNDGDLDANYFQHLPYMEKFNVDNKTELVSVAAIHYEPYGIYAGKTKSLTNLKDGAVVLVPNDATNEARALLLLEQEGLIKLKANAGINATKSDIAENPKKLVINEAEAAAITKLLPDADIAIVNGNYALANGLKVADALAVEGNTSIAAKTYANIICVKKGSENLDKIKALVEVLKSEKIKDFINTTYKGAVVPIF